MPEADPITVEIRNRTARISLNRPEIRNALSAAMVNRLHEAITAANADAAVRSIVLTGLGPAFCAGADLKSPPGGEVGAAGRAIGLPGLLNAMLESEKPILGAVNGAAFAGGLGLVAACDIVIAAEEAPFAFSEVRIGVIPAVISVVCVRKLGPHWARKLFMTGERFTGREAVALGFVHRAVPGSSLAAAVEEELAMLHLGGPIAVRECKKLVRQVSEMSITEGFATTAPWSLELFRSAEAAEGIAAFREKRPPSWTAGN